MLASWSTQKFDFHIISYQNATRAVLLIVFRAHYLLYFTWYELFKLTIIHHTCLCACACLWTIWNSSALSVAFHVHCVYCASELMSDLYCSLPALLLIGYEILYFSNIPILADAHANLLTTNDFPNSNIFRIFLIVIVSYFKIWVETLALLQAINVLLRVSLG